MQGPTKERWQELCKLAAVEQDPSKMLELIREINALLIEKEQRLVSEVSSNKPNNQTKP
jgi:hypothetical protein